MSRMKTFLIYFLIFAGFFIVSNLLEYGLILNMYADIEGIVNNNDNLTIDVEKAKATNVNGYMDMNIKNDSSEYLEKYYAKIDLYDKYNQESVTEYALISDLQPGECATYKISFRGEKINRYSVELVSEVPDKTNIINILGWELDATNLFGLGIDLTNIYGVDITQYLSIDGIKNGAKQAWDFGVDFAKDIPAWAYAIAALTILWYL